MIKLKKIATNNQFISVFIIGMLFVIYRIYSPFVYQTNDDMMFSWLVSGVETGFPETKLVYINSLLSIGLSLFYGFFPSIPWYGIFLCSVHFICMSLILYFGLRKCKSVKSKIFLIIVLSNLYTVLWLPQIAYIQFTVTSAVLSGTAIYCFYLSDQVENKISRRKTNILIGFLIGLSFCIRMEVTLMAIPFAFVVWILKLKEEDKSNFKIIFPNYLKFLLAIIGILVILFSINYISYNSTEWNEFDNYNKVRSELFDYPITPEYEDAKSICEKYNVSKESYIAMKEVNLLTLDSNISTSFLEELKNMANSSEKYQKLEMKHLGNLLFDYIKNAYMQDSPYLLIVICTYLLIIIILIINKNKMNGFIFLISVFLIRNFVGFLIFIQGRSPQRVVISLYMFEMLILLAYIIKCLERNFKKIFAILILSYLCIITMFGLKNLRIVKAINEFQLYNSIDYSALTEYIDQNPDNFYFLEIQIIMGMTEDIFQYNDKTLDNYVFTGGWLSRSPWYDKKYEKYGISEESLFDENVYMVFINNASSSSEYCFNYLEKAYPGIRFETISSVSDIELNEYEIIKLYR